MRILTHVNEFKNEAANAVFTKQQAVAATLQLLEQERQSPENSAADTELFTRALARAEYRYLDATKTDTDRMLDGLGVARFTTADIVEAINALLFDVG
ncbi:MAG: hypothetical protein HFE45_08555 [Oscillospiraceae bacterium]|jgi:hypothetical protein|nr:hypothetical protein [Oscillospiraceae bacterium]